MGDNADVNEAICDRFLHGSAASPDRPAKFVALSTRITPARKRRQKEIKEPSSGFFRVPDSKAQNSDGHFFRL